MIVVVKVEIDHHPVVVEADLIESKYNLKIEKNQRIKNIVKNLRNKKIDDKIILK